MSRSFTIEAIYKREKKISFNGGRYISDRPSNSASKAFTQFYRHYNYIGPMSVEIWMRETTQNSAKKLYKYKIKKVKNEINVERDGRIIKYKFSTNVKSL